MYALTRNGRVVQLADAVFPVHPSLAWEEVPAGVAVEVGWTWDGSTFTAPVVDLEASRANALRAIDAAAEAVRQIWITPGDGQALTYRLKAEEASALLAEVAGGGAPDPAGYPILAALVGIRGGSLEAVATTINATAQAWKGIAAQIEATREQAKMAVAGAGDVGAIQAVLEGLSWPAP